MPYEPTTNFRDSDDVDLGKKLVTKDYLLEVYGTILENSPASGLVVTPELWVWGNNGLGKLGINNTTDRSTPVTTFAGGNNWKQVSCMRGNTAAIKTDGSLWIWGNNLYYGQLGINAADVFFGYDRSTPVTTFAGGNDWKSVSGGTYHTVAIKTDGSLWVWGNNGDGQLGVNLGNINRLTPVTTFAGGNDWKSVSGGGQQTAAIKTDGSLWIWGRNNYAQLGINAGVLRDTPVTTFAGGTTWKQVSCYSDHMAAIKTDGSLWTWGRGGDGQLGTNDTTPNRSTPVTTFAGGNDWKSVSCGSRHTAAIKTDGSLWTWGRNAYYGQLGINNTATGNGEFIPTPVTTFAGGNNWKQVCCGDQYTTAIKTDGSLWVWGLTFSGQLGINLGGTVGILTPVTTFAGGNNWKQVSCRQNHTAAIQTIDYI